MAEPPPFGTGGFAVTRVFAAPPERVWREWTDPAAFADWFGGSDCEVPLSTVALDVRPGGAWRATMFCGPERREIRWTGEYREVAAPERLVLTFSDHPGSEAYELVTVVLVDLGDGRTEMRFEQRGHMTPEQYGQARSGWGGFFGRIEQRLASDDGSQLAALARLHAALEGHRIEYWVFGGWAVDLHVGSQTRPHEDLDVAVWQRDQDALARVLAADGWRHAPEAGGEGYTVHEREGVRLEVAFRDAGGAWPAGAFGNDVGELQGVRARVVTRAALLADKAEDHGDPRAAAKDRADLAALRALDA
jgi:uncharacterized protein YndB with AHSA1/START domain